MCQDCCYIGVFNAWKPLLKGDANSAIFSAATNEGAKTGMYYVPTATESSGSKYSQDSRLAGELWEWTEQQLAEHGY